MASRVVLSSMELVNIVTGLNFDQEQLYIYVQ
jgi:hypothetical protein